MTEPQPSRSVKRPHTIFIEAGSRLGPALPANPPDLGLPKKPVAGELHQFLIRPTTYATSSPVGRFSSGIGEGDRKFWGKLVFVGKLAYSACRSHGIL
jgi:hypothetical protein